MTSSEAVMFSATSASDVVRKSANFHPSLWGDYILNYTCDNKAIRACTDEVEKLKEEVRNILKEVQNEPSKQLNLIDALQRLGISYHFVTEMEEAMKQMYDNEIILSFLHNKNLHDVATCFRLLRQQGYNVSSDIFSKFKDNKGDDFDASLLDDARGMLSLYEAAHIRYHGEDVLEQALIFTTTNLTSMTKSSPSFSCSPLGRQVQHSLEQPLHKGVPRLEARHYISLYQENDEKWSDSVRKLAKLDFKLLQALYRRELCDLSRWWKDLDFASKLPFARNRLAECFFWIVATFYEPSYSVGREFLTKVLVLASIVDDIFDVYGTIEELKLFADAFERWDASCVNQRPGYINVCFQVILDEYEKMEEVMNKEGCSYQVHYAKEAMKDLVRAYLVEAKWYNEDHLPKFEEYLGNGLVSSGYYMFATTSLVGMGKVISEEAFEWIRGAPKPLRSSSLMARLINDVASHEFEQSRGHVASAVECYMEEFGASKQEAHDEINKIIEAAWKDVNQGCFSPSTTISRPLVLMRIVNLTRALYVIYKYEEDAYTHSTTRMKENVALLFIDPIDP